MLVSRDEQPVTALSLDGLAVELSRPPGGAGSLAEALYAGRIPLSRQGVRIVISDFLFPLDPGRLVRQLATGASTLWIIQVLSDWEQQPTYLGGRRLVDVESGQEIDLLLQRQMVTEYLSRLQRVQQDLREAARRHQATFLTVTAERGLAETCRQDLCTVGVLRVE